MTSGRTPSQGLAAALAAALPPDSMWGPVTWVASTGSTNADVAALARDGAPEGQVLVASEQTRGRGRLTRTWASPAGASVAISVLLEPRPDFLRWGWLSLLAGLAVQDAVAALAPDPATVELKWPNDVLVRGRKVCGILSERVEHATGPRAVVGMGLNLTLTTEQLPVETATSLELEGIPADAVTVVAAVLAAFEGHYRAWQAEGELRPAYESRCASVGRDLEIVVDAETPIRGRGAGVDELGRLLVHTPRGVRPFAVGDVTHARLAR